MRRMGGEDVDLGSRGLSGEEVFNGLGFSGGFRGGCSGHQLAAVSKVRDQRDGLFRWSRVASFL